MELNWIFYFLHCLMTEQDPVPATLFSTEIQNDESKAD
jgi:hypothetical protein